MENDLLDRIDAFIEVEVQMKLYYQALCDFIPEHRQTWQKLADQEYAHARALAKVRQAIRKNPYRFTSGKNTLCAAQSILSDTKIMIENILERKVHPMYAISFIADIETAAIEANLNESVQTDDLKLRNLMQAITNETCNHRDLLRSIQV